MAPRGRGGQSANRGAEAKAGRARGYDFALFRGYRGPRFTPIPDEFLDHQLADLTSAEAKVMLFLFRKTYGYRKSADRVSFAQLERGTISSDGTVIDRGTGLSKATIWRALKGLQKKGLIEVHRQTTPAGDADVNYYQIHEFEGPEMSEDSPSSSPQPPRSGPGVPPRTAAVTRLTPRRGLFQNETTPVSKVNDPGFTTERPGGFRTKTTREHYTREDYTTLTPAIAELAAEFLRSIGYAKPAKAKSERTIRILNDLALAEHYGLDELRTACTIAASLGARGPEFIPHVIGLAPSEQASEVGERFARSQVEERNRWQRLSDDFDSLPPERQDALLIKAQRSNPILAARPPDHPLVRAAAVALLEEDESRD